MLTLGLLHHFDVMNGELLLDLRFEAPAISNGDYWRLFSGHFVHLNLPHTFMNLGALCLLVMMFWKELSFREDMSALLASIVGINIGLYFFHPELTNYAGFSGVLHGLFVYYFLKTLPLHKRGSYAALSLITVKIMWEQSPWADSSETANLIGGNVATVSHLYGGLCGALAGMSFLFFKKNNKNTLLAP